MTQQIDSDFKERRRFERRKSTITGLAELPFRNPITCTLEDISVAGARIVPSEPVWIPQVFQLVIPSGDFKTYCEVRHRDARGVGVAFISAPNVGDIEGFPQKDESEFSGPEVLLSLS